MNRNSGPVRLDGDLLDLAATEGARQRRSAPKQIEFWADLGRAVDGLLTVADAVALRSGLLHLAPSASPRIDPALVMSELEERRESLAGEVTRARVRYQASDANPGCLEQIGVDGRVVVGRFVNGEFVPLAA